MAIKKYLIKLVVSIIAFGLTACANNKQISIEEPGYDGNRLLHTAASNDSNEVIEHLIRMGAEVNAKNKYGQTPLMIAAQKNNFKSVTALLAAKANINLKDNKYHTALFYAIDSYSVMTIGATADVKNPNVSVGWRVRNDELVRALIYKGAYLTYPEFIPLEDDSISKQARFKCAVARVKIYKLEMPCQDHLNLSYSDSWGRELAKATYKSCAEVTKKQIPTIEQYLEENCAEIYY